MKIMPCPLNGPRNINEFTYGGELKQMPDPATCSDAEWADFLFMRRNVKGPQTERWYHVAGCRRWFTLLRDSATHEQPAGCETAPHARRSAAR